MYSMAGISLEAVQKLISKTEEEYNMIQQLDVSIHEGKSLTKDQQLLLKSKNSITRILAFLKHAKEISSCRKSSKKHGRYLCISNGEKLVCLDLIDGLKQEPIDKPQPLPKFHTVIAEEILGQQKGPQLSGTIFSCFAFLAQDSLSWIMYRLSMDGANFCLSEADNTYTPRTSSRKIEKAWLTCSAQSDIQFICGLGEYNQVVIADKVYFTDIYSTNALDFGVYSTTTSWRSKYPFPTSAPLRSKYPYPVVSCCMTMVRHVGELLLFAFVRCIGKLEHSDSSNPLYVVIAVMRNLDIPGAAVAYLVTSTGHVVCYQLLPNFFGGIIKFHSYFYQMECEQFTVISVDEEVKTWCVIVLLHCLGQPDQYLFISTFTVEENLYDILHGSLLPSMLAEKRREGDDIWDVPFPRELDFLNVEVKEWNVYDFSEAEMGHFTHLSACFMSTQ